jgi:hypothetical protein
MKLEIIPSFPLLQFFQKVLDDQLQDLASQPSESGPPGDDGDEAFEEGIQRDLFRFEARVGQIPGGRYDLAGRDPSSNALVEKEIKKQVKYFEERVWALRLPPEPRANRHLGSACRNGFTWRKTQFLWFLGGPW